MNNVIKKIGYLLTGLRCMHTEYRKEAFLKVQLCIYACEVASVGISYSECQTQSPSPSIALGEDIAYAGTFLINTENISATDYITIYAPEGFDISESPVLEGAGTATSIQSTTNYPTIGLTKQYWLYLTGTSVGDFSGSIIFKDKEDVEISATGTSCIFSGSVTAPATKPIIGDLTGIPSSFCEGVALTLTAPLVTGIVTTQGWQISAEATDWQSFTNGDVLPNGWTTVYVRFYASNICGTEYSE